VLCNVAGIGGFRLDHEQTLEGASAQAANSAAHGAGINDTAAA